MTKLRIFLFVFCTVIVGGMIAVCINVFPTLTTSAKELNSYTMTPEIVQSIVTSSSFDIVPNKLNTLRLEYTYGEELEIPKSCVYRADEGVLVYTHPSLDYAEYVFKVDATMHKKELTISYTEPNFVYNGHSQSIANYISLQGVVEGDNVPLVLSGSVSGTNAGKYFVDCFINPNDHYTLKSETIEWSIARASLNASHFSLMNTELTFTGKALTPNVLTTSYLSTDFLVEYDSNVHIGTGRVIIEGKGNYTGTVELLFNILPVEAGSNSSATIVIRHPINQTMLVIIVLLGLLVVALTIWIITSHLRRKTYNRIDYFES